MPSRHEQNQKYVSRLLQLNPLEQATEILNSRQRYLKPDEPVFTFLSESELDFDERKQQVREELDSLRNVFWKLEEGHLKQRIDSVQIDEFPDLGFALSRLQKVAQLKSSFQQLSHHPACFDAFYEKFCQLVIAPPSKADELRARFLESTDQETFEFDFQTDKEYRVVARVIKQDFPELYELEKYWLNQVAVMGTDTSPISSKVTILYSCIVLALVLILTLGLIYFPEITLITFPGILLLFGVTWLIRRFVVRIRSQK